MPQSSPTALLFAAIKANDIPAAQESIALGAALHGKRGKLSRSPAPLLEEAIKSGSTEMVSLLIDAGCRLSPTSRALHYAIEGGNLAVFKKVLDVAPSKAFITGIKDTYTPLMHAAHLAHLGMCKMLIDRGASPKLCNKDGLNSLYYALQCSSQVPSASTVEMVKLLLEKGGLINKPYPNDISPMQCAALLWMSNKRFAHEGLAIKLFELMLDHGADINEITRHGTILHIIATNDALGFDHNMIPFLVKAGADVNAKNSFSAPPLHYAASIANTSDGMVPLRQLLAAGADVAILDNSGKTALHWATSASAAILLLDSGVDPSICDIFGETAESYSALNEYLAEVHAFLRATRTHALLEQSTADALASSPRQRM
jgi:ankyrin repeat protein